MTVMKISGEQREEFGVVGIVRNVAARPEDIETDHQRSERGSRQERRNPRRSWERHSLARCFAPERKGTGHHLYVKY